MGSCVGHFNVSLIVLAKSQDSVHKPQFYLDATANGLYIAGLWRLGSALQESGTEFGSVPDGF